MQATPTIQGNPSAIMDGSLNNSYGGFNPSLVNEYLGGGWPAYAVNSLPLITLLIHRLHANRTVFHFQQFFAGADGKHNPKLITL